ncbi:hypothetical protein ACGFYP_02420 [Streptomyces sp. NPDC048370]|uniref:hypothetical protein n=1 Tax=Streptomyces sp. NPDC048370 TaxID=3365540 RepID=UPI00371AA0A8
MADEWDVPACFRDEKRVELQQLTIVHPIWQATALFLVGTVIEGFLEGFETNRVAFHRCMDVIIAT